MTLARIVTKRYLASAALLPSVVAVLAAASPNGFAQESGHAGDIIVEREVMPRDAFRALPHDENPVAVKATTFRPSVRSCPTRI